MQKSLESLNEIQRSREKEQCLSRKNVISTLAYTAIQVDGYSLDAQKDKPHYLNDNEYNKKLRKNNTIPGFSSSFVKSMLDNPVYMGKIAYGRRRTEKRIGIWNEMHIVEKSEFSVYEGCHEAIISETDWQLAQEKLNRGMEVMAIWHREQLLSAMVNLSELKLSIRLSMASR